MSEQPMVFEEVPGSRTTQDAVVQPQRERIAYEELQPGEIIQEGDEWQNEFGRWRPFLVLDGSRVQVRQSQRVRRPYKISTILEIGDALANTQKAATQLQDERDKLRAEMDIVKGDRMNLREALAAEQRAHTVTMASGLQACKERDEALAELAQAREGNQDLLKTIAENADMFGDHTKALVQERDEARAERDKLKGLVDDLLDEPTAKQVQQMLRTWATELDWSAGCFDSVGRDRVSAMQRVLVVVIERIEGLVNPEGGTDDN